MLTAIFAGPAVAIFIFANGFGAQRSLASVRCSYTWCRPGPWRAMPGRSSRPAVESLNKEIVIRVTRNSGVQAVYSRARRKGAAAAVGNCATCILGSSIFAFAFIFLLKKSFTLMCWHHCFVPNSAFGQSPFLAFGRAERPPCVSDAYSQFCDCRNTSPLFSEDKQVNLASTAQRIFLHQLG